MPQAAEFAAASHFSALRVNPPTDKII